MNLHPREQEMTTSYRLFRPEPRPSFDSQLEALPPDVKSVAESLALRDMESAKRYVSQYLSANRGIRS